MPEARLAAGPDRPPRLLDQVRTAIHVRHLSRQTERAYVQWIRRFILFHGKRHPREMGAREITSFLSHLAETAAVSPSTQNQALNGILFLYRHVLRIEVGALDGVVRAKRRRRLPVVLSREEVQALVSQLHGVHRLVASLLYGSGLRPGTPRSQERQDDDDLHPCPEQGRSGRPEPARHPLSQALAGEDRVPQGMLTVTVHTGISACYHARAQPVPGRAQEHLQPRMSLTACHVARNTRRRHASSAAPRVRHWLRRDSGGGCYPNNRCSIACPPTKLNGPENSSRFRGLRESARRLVGLHSAQVRRDNTRYLVHTFTRYACSPPLT